MSARNALLDLLTRLRLRAPIARLVRTARATPRVLREEHGTRRTARAVRRMLARELPWETPWGEPDASDLALVMCLWNRPVRLESILPMLDAQESPRRIRLVLWNNDPANTEHYRRVLAAFSPRGALRSVELHESTRNIGGIGRFVAQRGLVRSGYTGPFVMLDDDQDVSARFIADLLDCYTDRSVSGVWAWRTKTSYWDRTQVTSHGESANHIGTGGSICDSRLLADDSFFTAIPPRFLFIEDMWMSACAAANGWRLAMVDSPVTFVLDHLDQGHHIRGEKEQFYSWIRQHPERIPRLPA